MGDSRASANSIHMEMQHPVQVATGAHYGPHYTNNTTIIINGEKSYTSKEEKSEGSSFVRAAKDSENNASSTFLSRDDILHLINAASFLDILRAPNKWEHYKRCAEKVRDFLKEDMLSNTSINNDLLKASVLMVRYYRTLEKGGLDEEALELIKYINSKKINDVLLDDQKVYYLLLDSEVHIDSMRKDKRASLFNYIELAELLSKVYPGEPNLRADIIHNYGCDLILTDDYIAARKNLKFCLKESGSTDFLIIKVYINLGKSYLYEIRYKKKHDLFKNGSSDMQELRLLHCSKNSQDILINKGIECLQNGIKLVGNHLHPDYAMLYIYLAELFLTKCEIGEKEFLRIYSFYDQAEKILNNFMSKNNFKNIDNNVVFNRISFYIYRGKAYCAKLKHSQEYQHWYEESKKYAVKIFFTQEKIAYSVGLENFYFTKAIITLKFNKQNREESEDENKSENVPLITEKKQIPVILNHPATNRFFSKKMISAITNQEPISIKKKGWGCCNCSCILM